MKARPALVAHADWGKDPKKRWVATAQWTGERYEALSVKPVSDTARLVRTLLREARGGSLLLGFDFPIGLPAAYAHLAGIQNFRRFLSQLGRGRWAEFGSVARHRHEISRYRPSYPHVPGGKRKAHLLEGLEFTSTDLLLRHCERATDTRGAASALFWTLGAKQSGRAAITGWLEVLQPALRDLGSELALWPFDGSLDELLLSRKVVICETYPANTYPLLGLPPAGRGWSKRNPEHRLRHATIICNWARRQRITLRSGLGQSILEGFGPRADGEDPFDATIRLLGMLELIQSERDHTPRLPRRLLDIEGWMLGFDAR